MTRPDVQAFYDDPMAFFEAVHIPVNGRGVALGDVMTPEQRQWLTALSPALRAVARGERSPTVQKFFWEAVKGNAKTTIDGLIAIYLIVFAVVQGLLVQVFASDEDQAAELLRAAAAILRLSGNAFLAEVAVVLTDRIVCQRTDSTVEVCPADISGSHGSRPNCIIIDEACHIQKTEVVENAEDNATKIATSLTIYTTNAGFTGTWYWKRREHARTSRQWYFQQTTTPPPWIPQEEIEEARARNTPSRFARLWQGVPSSGVGDIVDPNDIAACVTMSGPMTAAESGFVFVGGLDLGIRHDHSALAILGIHRQNRRRRLALVRRWAPDAKTGKVDLQAVQNGVKAACEVFGPRIYYDPYQCELLAVQLRRQGCRLIETPFSGANLNEMASEFIETFTSRNLDLYNDAGLLRDIGRLTIVEKSYGYKLESVRDADGHADSATALALALLAAKHTPVGGAFTVAVYDRNGKVASSDDDVLPKPTRGWWMPNFLSQHGRQASDTDGVPTIRQGESLTDYVRRAQNSTVVRGGQRPIFKPDNLARHGEE